MKRLPTPAFQRIAALLLACLAAGARVAAQTDTPPTAAPPAVTPPPADATTEGGGIEWLGGEPPPAPADLAAHPEAYEDLLAENGLSLDLKKGTVAVRGGTLHDQASLGYPIEYLVVTERGRTHEALFVVKARPSLLDACLRALDLRPGTPMRFRLKENQPSQDEVEAGTASPWDPVPPSGPLVSIDVAWTDDAGLPHRASLESLLVDAATNEALPEDDWVYTGSGFGTLRQGRKEVQAFIADLQGDVVAIYLTGQGASLLERNSLDGVDDTRYSLNPATMPARGTPVTMILSRTGRVTAPAPSRAAPPVVAGETGAKLDDFLTRLVPWGFSGVVAVQRGDELLLHKGYGLGDRQTGLPVDTGSAFPLSSLSKQFTAAFILKLAADGKLSLDDNISHFLKRVPEDKAAITVRTLLSHTSGLPQDSEPAPASADRAAAVASVLATPLVGEPGAAFVYSNAGYVLLAAIAEEAGASTYRTLLGEDVIGPAGMLDTGLFGEPMWDGSQLVHGYADGAEDLASAVAQHGPAGTALGRDLGTPAKGALVWNRLGAGAAVCTVRDLLKWELALRDGKVLGEASLKEMFTPGLDHYGFAWWIEDTRHGRLAWHDGILPGFRVEVLRYLDENLIVIVAANAEFNGVSTPVAALAFGDEVPLPPQRDRTMSSPLELPASGIVQDTREVDGARGVRRQGVDEAARLAGEWLDGATRAPLFTLRAIGEDLFLVPSSESVYEALGPAFGFRAATLKDRMTRRGGLRLRPVSVPAMPSADSGLQWGAFEAVTCGSLVLQSGGGVCPDGDDGLAIFAGHAEAVAAPLLVACRKKP